MVTVSTCSLCAQSSSSISADSTACALGFGLLADGELAGWRARLDGEDGGDSSWAGPGSAGSAGCGGCFGCCAPAAHAASYAATSSGAIFDLGSHESSSSVQPDQRTLNKLVPLRNTSPCFTPMDTRKSRRVSTSHRSPPRFVGPSGSASGSASASDSDDDDEDS